MSEEKGNLGDNIKKEADEAAKKVKETAENFRDEMKETVNSNENKKILAGILALVIGGLGIHKFILGYNKEGFIMLICTIILGTLTCGLAGWVVWVVSIIEGIIYLTKSDEEFYQTYQANKKPWF
ncbi:TM2 domain-containing protein [Aquimarina sp. M1]